jgi:dTDP-4-amino-4,6-dideoxygalactose transaminase
MTDSKLAIHGGEPYRTASFPSVGNASGRMLGDEELELLTEVIRSGHLNRVGGTKVPALEEAFAEIYGREHAVAVTSGTAALHTAVGALNLEPGDEVITTTVTDMGTIIAILMCNLVPIFADIDPRTGIITAETIEAQITEKTQAIIVVHLFGQMADMDPILALAAKHDLAVIEDCAQAHMSEYKGHLSGTMGDMGCFSFQQSKQMTTGDGGMVITDDGDLARHARLFADKGWPRGSQGERGHLFLGPNYRMTELQGAVGLAQVGKIKEIVARRRKTAEMLAAELADIPGINPPYVLPEANPTWWILPFTIDEDVLGVTPSEFSEAIRAEGMPFRVGYIPNPIFEYPVIRDRKTFGSSGIPWTLPQARKGITYDRADYPGTMQFLTETFVTSWNEGMTEDDVKDIAGGLSKVARYFRERA